MPGRPSGRILLGFGLILALCALLLSGYGSQTASHGALPTALLPPLLARPPTPARPDSPPSALGKLKRVAIVGAGASGSAAAFFLERAARSTEGEGEVQLVVFERDARVGGRSTTVRPYGPEGSEGEGEKVGEGKIVELGASIFVEANQNLMRAVDRFNLSLVPFADDDRPSAGHDPLGMGLYDGSRFVLTTSSALGWWEKAKLLWRYGYVGPTRTRTAIDGLVASFKQMYDARWVAKNGPWETIEGLSQRLGLGDPTAVTGEDWFRDQVKVEGRFVDEMVEAVLRVNYAQDVVTAHGLAAAVSLATTGASSVTGGNWRIFERFLAASEADVRLNTTVHSIRGFEDARSGLVKYAIRAVNGPGRQLEDDVYDAVIFAGPFHQSGIELLGTLAPAADAIPPQPYVHLHTTLLSTTNPAPNPAYFHLGPSAAPPSAILTTGAAFRAGDAVEPEFQSITYHGEVSPGAREWVVKIFSKEERSDAWLERVFGEGQVRWVRRKEWQSYPLLPPTTVFPPITPLEGQPFFLLSAMEPWISTMETQTLSARNAVGLLARAWWGVRMGSCLAGEGVQARGEVLEDGWDWTC